MTDTDVLRRRYQRLLWAYPNWYRQERGLEMLSTLLEGADSGQRWPSNADVRDVVGRGLRCRFRPPRGRQYALIIVIAGLFCAFAGSAAVAMTFAHQPPVPSEDEVVAVAELATGQPARNLASPVVACTYYCPEQWRPDGDQVVTFDDPFEENGGVDHVTVVYWTPVDQLPLAVDEARNRLHAKGWEISDFTVQDNGTRHFSATNDGLSVYLAGFTDAYGGPPLRLSFERQLPGLPAAAITGLVIGLLIGWLLTAWVLQRYRRHHLRVKVATIVCAVPVMAVLLLTDLMILRFGAAVVFSAPPAFLSLLPAIGLSVLQSLPGIWPIAIVTGVAAAAAVSLAALPIRAAVAQEAPTPAS